MSLADQAIVSGTSFFMTMAVGRFTNPSELGIYSVGSSLLISMVGVQGSLICLPYTIQSGQSDQHEPERLGDSLAQSFLLSMLIAIVLAAAGCGLSLMDGKAQVTRIAWLLAPVVPFVLLREFARQNAFAHLRIGRALFLDAGAAAVQAAVIAWLAWNGHMQATTAYTAICVGCGTAGAAWLFNMRQGIKLPIADLWASTKRNWMLGRWLLAGQITVSVQGYAAFWMLGWVLGVAAAGIYTACMTVVLLANPLLMGLGNVLIPRAVRALATGGTASVRRQVIFDSILLGAAMVAFCVMVWFFGDRLMSLAFRDEAYTGTGRTQILLVLGIGILASAVSMPASNALASLEQPHAIFWAGLFGAAVSIMLSWSLAVEIGVLGAAYGFTAGHMAGMAARWLAFVAVVRHLNTETETGGMISGRVHADIMSVLSQSALASPGSIRDIQKLGEGDEAAVYEVRFSQGSSAGRPPPPVAVKLYKPAAARAVDLVQTQFRLLAESHRALATHTTDGWTALVPAPLFVSAAPLALVMTAVRGKPIFQGPENGGHLPPQDSGSLARAVVSALGRLWSQGIQHGDLNLDNVLCDAPGRTITFVDPSEPPAFCRTGRIHDPWYLASCDLGHFLYEEATNLRRFIGSRSMRKRRWRFIETILSAHLETIECPGAKLSFISQVRSLGRTHLVMLRFSWSPRGVWLILIKAIAALLIDRMAGRLMRQVRQAATSNMEAHSSKV